MQHDAASNKALMKAIFDALAQGNGKPFGEAMAEDFCWTLPGSTAWSRSYRGKDEVRRELLKPLFAQFADTYTNSAQRFIAEDDWVVVQCQGKVATTSGKRYDNSYCYVCRLEEGKLKELIEYMDTQLVADVLVYPSSA